MMVVFFYIHLDEDSRRKQSTGNSNNIGVYYTILSAKYVSYLKTDWNHETQNILNFANYIYLTINKLF